jgi:hypothetical protein
VDQERAFSLTGDEWAIQAETGGASPKARAWGIAIYRLFGKERRPIQHGIASDLLGRDHP